MYFFGSHSVEPWQNTGTGNPPFARVSSGVQPYGLAGTHAIVATDEYMYFLDTKRVPRRSNGLNFLNIGNPALGVEFAKYSKIDDCICFEFTQDNQQFVAFTFPTADKTWCFHEASGSWFQLSHGVNGSRHRASSMLNIYGLNYCADHTNGLVYEYSLDLYSDNGEPIIKQRDTAAIHGGLFGVPGKKLFFDEVEFIIVAGQTEVEGTGLGPQPIEPPGICGSVDDLDRGQLLGPTPLSLPGQVGACIFQSLPLSNGVLIEDSDVISFTCAFTREAAPNEGVDVYAFQVWNNTDDTPNFGFFMDASGYMNVTARDVDLNGILNVQIRNAGGSFADSTLYMFGVVIDLTDETKREVYVNGLSVGESPTWTTWNTYTNANIKLSDSGAAPHSLSYYFGRGHNYEWGSVACCYKLTRPRCRHRHNRFCYA